MLSSEASPGLISISDKLVSTKTTLPCGPTFYLKGIDVSLPDRHSSGHSAIKPSTTGIVFHRQPLTGLVIMRTCRDTEEWWME